MRLPCGNHSPASICDPAKPIFERRCLWDACSSMTAWVHRRLQRAPERGDGRALAAVVRAQPSGRGMLLVACNPALTIPARKHQDPDEQRSSAAQVVQPSSSPPSCSTPGAYGLRRGPRYTWIGAGQPRSQGTVPADRGLNTTGRQCAVATRLRSLDLTRRTGHGSGSQLKGGHAGGYQ